MESFSEATRSEAWLKAAHLLLDREDRIYNLVVEIEKPDSATPASRAIEARVDDFLRQHDKHPIHTVAETIFPATEYRTKGLAGVFAYAESIYPEIKSVAGNTKGTYALRLVKRLTSEGERLNPLELAIEKLRRQLKAKSTKRAVYELDLSMEALDLKFYDPEQDHNNAVGGQCLSHVSLKLGPSHELYLTALYRYQFFIQKALGNFKGLARLQACIANEVGIPIGPLVCHATLAVLDDDKVGATWKRLDLIKLIKECDSIRGRTVAGRAA